MMTWTINGRVYNPTEVAADEIVYRDTPTAWEWVNLSPIPHPMHVHNARFQALQRDASGAAASYANISQGLVDDGWKDTVLVWPGEWVKIAIKFGPYMGMYLGIFAGLFLLTIAIGGSLCLNKRLSQPHEAPGSRDGFSCPGKYAFSGFDPSIFPWRVRSLQGKYRYQSQQSG